MKSFYIFKHFFLINNKMEKLIEILNDNKEYFNTPQGQKTIESFKIQLDKKINESTSGEKLLEESQELKKNIIRTGSDILKNNS
tara:strand:+ start:348 stop:599 length:252 start_codon:yes stop_codon:yes gene_type:complete